MDSVETIGSLGRAAEAYSQIKDEIGEQREGSFTEDGEYISGAADEEFKDTVSFNPTYFFCSCVSVVLNWQGTESSASSITAEYEIGEQREGSFTEDGEYISGAADEELEDALQQATMPPCSALISPFAFFTS